MFSSAKGAPPKIANDKTSSEANANTTNDDDVANDDDTASASRRVSMAMEPDGADSADFETAGYDFFHALGTAGFDMKKVKSMTMGQIAATFTDEAVFGHGTATASAAGSDPAPASVPSAAAAANEYHDWRDEDDWRHHEDQRHFQRGNEGPRIFSRENQGKHSRSSSAGPSTTFKEDWPITLASSG